MAFWLNTVPALTWNRTTMIDSRAPLLAVVSRSTLIEAAYDPARNLWYELPPMTVARHGFAGGIINGVFHTVTGQLQSGTGGGGPGGSPAHEGFIIGKLAGGTR